MITFHVSVADEPIAPAAHDLRFQTDRGLHTQKRSRGIFLESRSSMTAIPSLHCRPGVLAGSCHPSLTEEFARCMGTPKVGRLERFPDGEIHVEADASVRGCPTVIIQSLGAPVGDHLLELLLLADAAWRAGATCITAVIPYLAYARHDRRMGRTEPLGCRVIADLIGTAKIERVVVVDLHTPAVEGFFSTKVEHLTAVPLLAETLRPRLLPNSVIVSPDLGGVKLAESYARALDLPMAIVHKSRTSASDVKVERIVGDVRGLRPIVVDDIIATGGTIAAACNRLLAEGAVPDVTVVATHAVLTPRAIERLSELPMTRLVTTDSLPPKKVPFACETVSLAPLLAAEVLRPLSDGAAPPTEPSGCCPNLA